ncbi:MAG TPA: hypothetical protein DIT25_02480 [Candidatus Moranbacteria bacterium]|nr:hypothetical protein [Candidatus Moranbacteria bacterium]
MKNNFLLDIQETHQNVLGIIEYSIEPDFSLSEKINFTKDFGRENQSVDDFIWIKKIKEAEYAMDLISPLGKIGSMCGNGLISILKSLRKKEFELREITVRSLAGTKKVFFRNGKYEAVIGSVNGIQYLEIEGGSGELFRAHFVDLGEPHIVIEKKGSMPSFLEMEKIFLRYNQEGKIFPSGINFNLVTLKRNNTLEVETFERGCLRKTKACGTGSVSAAAVFQSLGKIESERVNIQTEGGNFQVMKVGAVYSIITKKI